MNILITGIHGFVGTNLVAELKDKHNIYGIDIIAPEKSGVICTYTWADLDKLLEIDVIIHLAGKAHDTKKQSEAKAYFDINTELTQKIYDWFFKSVATKFIFFSSVKAVADFVEGDFLTEEVVPNPVGAYGESKIAAEKYILQNLSSEKKVYILRPCMIHGAGNKGNLNLLYNWVKKGIPYPLGGFDNKRSFTSIDNLSFVVEQLIEKNVESGIYNMADDDVLSTNELIRLIASIVGKPDRIWSWPPQFIRFCTNIMTKLHFPLNNERLQKLTENYVVSNKKIKNAIGVKKMPVTTKNGLFSTIKSFER